MTLKLYFMKCPERKISQENTCRPATLLKKETLALVFSSGFCEISKNNFFYRTLLVAASVQLKSKHAHDYVNIYDIKLMIKAHTQV